ncbi:MAG: hypothetical protein GY953_09605 [bacterium]|nr:hypothetical protein [bacterium]
MRGHWVAVLLLLASGATAGERGFDGLVRDIESEYDAERLKIPLFGLVNAAMRVVARPIGVSGMKLAIFEDIDVPYGREGRFLDLVRDNLDNEWRPMIRVYSPRDAEWTTILAKPDGKHMKLLLAVYEPGEAVVIQMRINPKTFSRWARHPLFMPDHMRSNRN